MLLLLAIMAAGPALANSCSSDLQCSLNGRCGSSACNCFAGWKGSECELLDLGPADGHGGAYVRAGCASISHHRRAQQQPPPNRRV